MILNNDKRVIVDTSKSDIVYFSFNEEITQVDKVKIKQAIEKSHKCFVFWLNSKDEEMIQLCKYSIDNYLKIYPNMQFYILTDNEEDSNTYAFAGTTINKTGLDKAELYTYTDKTKSTNQKIYRIGIQITNQLGESYSAPSEDIIAKIKSLNAIGVVDIALTGSDVFSYTYDNKTFRDLCEQIQNECPQIKTLLIDSWTNNTEQNSNFLAAINEHPKMVKYASLDLTKLMGHNLSNIQDREIRNKVLELSNVLHDYNMIHQLDFQCDLSILTSSEFEYFLDFINATRAERVSVQTTTSAFDYQEERDIDLFRERASQLRKNMRKKVDAIYDTIPSSTDGEKMAKTLLEEAYEVSEDENQD